MKVTIESSRIVKPSYEGSSPPKTSSIPLCVFDKVTFNTYMSVIYAYRPPTPPNEAIERGLQKALSEYREFAGRFGESDEGDSLILLNDEGVRFVEASADIEFHKLLPFKPSMNLLSLLPDSNRVEELVQVQLTRFICGSLVVGFSSHHFVGDASSASNFLVAWGKACRGLDMNPLPTHDRTIFTPRDPPSFKFEHRGVEFMSKKLVQDKPDIDNVKEDIVVRKVHFTLDFLAKLKAKASPTNGTDTNKTYSTFVSLLAHLWRVVTEARRLNGVETTKIRISVNGRRRLIPRVPDEYFGNLVLWAFPSAKVKDLLREPLSYAAKLIHDSIANVNDNYFRSFIDFASYKVEEEELVPTADMNKSYLCPNLEVDSWLHFPFHDLDFGGGGSHIFMPSYYPTEGMMFLLPSFLGDGSIDAFVPLFQDNLVVFNQLIYSID